MHLERAPYKLRDTPVLIWDALSKWLQRQAKSGRGKGNFRVKRKKVERFEGLSPGGQGHNPALTGLQVPYRLVYRCHID